MDLNQYIQNATGYSQGTVMSVLDSAAKGICVALRQGESGVKVPGLGTFSFQDKPERPGRNPRTGEEITIAASRKANFKFDKNFVKQIQPDSAICPWHADAIAPELPGEPAPAIQPTSVAAPVAAPAPVPFVAPVPANFPHPIPTELLQSKWHITKANGEYVELLESQLLAAGVTPVTPLWNASTGWKLAKDIPSLGYLFSASA